MTLEASSEIVFAITPPQPSSRALPMTLAFVPGGPEPMTKGLGSFRPLTVVASVGIHASSLFLFNVLVRKHEQRVNHKCDNERHEPCISIQPVEDRRDGFEELYLVQKSRQAGKNRDEQGDDGVEICPAAVGVRSIRIV